MGNFAFVVDCLDGRPEVDTPNQLLPGLVGPARGCLLALARPSDSAGEGCFDSRLGRPIFPVVGDPERHVVDAQVPGHASTEPRGLIIERFCRVFVWVRPYPAGGQDRSRAS